MELSSLGSDVVFPEVRRDGSSGRVVYRDVLHPNTRLVIGPGAKATLFPKPLFDEKVRRFHPNKPGKLGAVQFKEGYAVFAASGAAVRTGETYKCRVTAWADDGGNCLVIARFSGSEGGKATYRDASVVDNSCTDTPRVVESAEIQVPRFDHGEASMVLRFYRSRNKGSVYYQSFDCRRADLPQQGLNVSRRLDGRLGDLVAPWTVWIYRDRSDPDAGGGPKLELRFLGPEEAKARQITDR
jgi:hypothetical protein